MFYLWERLKLVVEPTGALGAAAALEGTTPIRGAPRRRHPERRQRRSDAGRRMARSTDERAWSSRRRGRRLGRSLRTWSRLAASAGCAAGRAERRRGRERAGHASCKSTTSTRPCPIDGLGGLARVATLKQQLAAAGPHAVLVVGRRLPLPVGRLERLQGRADDRRAQRRRPRPRHARQPRVRLRRRRPDPADGGSRRSNGSCRTSSTRTRASRSAARRPISSRRSAR